MHDSSTKFEIEVRFNTLLRNGLCDSASRGKELIISEEVSDKFEQQETYPFELRPSN